MKEQINNAYILHALQRRGLFTAGISLRPHWLVRVYGWCCKRKDDEAKKAYIESKTACIKAAEAKAMAWYETKVGPLKIMRVKLEAIAAAATDDDRGHALEKTCQKEISELKELLASCQAIIASKAEARQKRGEALIDAFCQGANYKT